MRLPVGDNEVTGMNHQTHGYDEPQVRLHMITMSSTIMTVFTVKMNQFPVLC